MTEEQFNKLPKWAQEEFKTIQRQREEAIKSLNEYVDNQTESPFSVDDYVSTGEEEGPSKKVRYIQAYCVRVKHAGVDLRVYANEDNSIRIQYGKQNYSIGEVALIPVSFQTIEIKASSNLRT